MQPVVDIAFDCLPLRSIGRVDVPLDASAAFRHRCERLQHAIARHGTDRAYYLYNGRCTYRLANSDIDNMLRFSFDGTLLTDRSDGKADRTDLDIKLTAETCGGVPPAAVDWLRGVVEKAILIEFNHFIAAGHLQARVAQLGQLESIADVEGFAGMNV
jgi:hypothetical protein